MIDDLRHFDADSFQLFPPETVGYVLLCLVALAAIFEPLVR
jgi:hypothetical protein